MKAALRPKDAGDLKLPWKIYQPAHLENMIQCQVGWAFVKIGSVVKCSGLLHEVSVPARERSVSVVLRCAGRVCGWAGLGYFRHDSDELVRWKRVDAERVVG